MMAIDLVKLLDDPRPAVQHRAIETLAGKGEGAVALLTQVVTPDRSINARRNAVWTATRIDHPAARVVITTALLDPDETVRQVAIHAAQPATRPGGCPGSDLAAAQSVASKPASRGRGPGANRRPRGGTRTAESSG